MKFKFSRICLQATACVVAFQSSLQAEEKPRFSARVVAHCVPATEKDPGITKMYDIVLINKSDETLFVNQCEFTEDTRNKFVETPYVLQRWNQKTNNWDTVAAGCSNYCQSSKWTRGRVIKTAVAPGKKLEVVGDVVGARPAFSYGDRARFLVFLEGPEDYDNVVESPEFQLDEHKIRPGEPKPEPPKVEPKILSVRRSEASTEYLLDVSFLTPDACDEHFSYVEVYGTQMIGGVPSNAKDYLVLRGDWMPNEPVEFSVRVPKESADPAKGWALTFCVGVATKPVQNGVLDLRCYASPNLLTRVVEHGATAPR